MDGLSRIDGRQDGWTDFWVHFSKAIVYLKTRVFCQSSSTLSTRRRRPQLGEAAAVGTNKMAIPPTVPLQQQAAPYENIHSGGRSWDIVRIYQILCEPRQGVLK